ncbi:hypothetical protein BDN72DRAFT_830346 [Pluteus cervinus]|uniref:Uncharacterized protein n=1 Tax=Pluteus cervinus TaxID=181527 RepID=A0ACD3BJ39_9AGAR|nr:hypothetical protein BDN72DRAFT_830346 [Pluteus cervinus]
MPKSYSNFVEGLKSQGIDVSHTKVVRGKIELWGIQKYAKLTKHDPKSESKKRKENGDAGSGNDTVQHGLWKRQILEGRGAWNS